MAFGKPIPSVYLDSDPGVMFIGGIDRYISNLSHLPVKSQKINEGLESSSYFSSLNSSTVDLYKKSVFDDEITEIVVEAKFAVLDRNNNLVESELKKATDEFLSELEPNDSVGKFSELDLKLIDDCLQNTTRKDDGRLVMPLMWRSEVSHLLGQNYNLSKSILFSNLKRIQNKRELLDLYDKSIKQSEDLGIIEKIDDLQSYITDNPACSFLPHMPIFKLNRESTKCRVVFLSNLCEPKINQKATISHNKAMYAGPSLNPPIVNALLQIRFDSNVIFYDIVKAFNQIELYPRDQERLLFLWFRNVSRGDFSIVAFRNVRLSFGLRCSPAILMLALHKILMIDSLNDDPKLKEAKKLLYSLFYMDNGSYTCDNDDDLFWMFDNLKDIFSPYKIELQQMLSNNTKLQNKKNSLVGEEAAEEVKLLGLCWNRVEDTLSTFPISLNVNANTKRLVLKTLAEQFDLFNFHGPILNRARLFLHKLQCRKDLKWDDHLSSEDVKEWKLIAKQANSSPPIKIKRFVGQRAHDYHLTACVDASSSIYGAVIFIKDIDTDQTSFVLAKSKVVNSAMSNKSIPSLELLAIVYGLRLLSDVKNELNGSNSCIPINVKTLSLFSDSLVALSWVNSWTHGLEKMNKSSVFVKNKLSEVDQICRECPVEFNFISGAGHPADFISKCVSYKLLIKSNYFSGPSQENVEASKEIYKFKVPNPNFNDTFKSDFKDFGNNFNDFNTSVNVTESSKSEVIDSHLISLDRFSSFQKLVKVTATVIKCFSKWNKVIKPEEHCLVEANTRILLNDQSVEFPEILNYFKAPSKVVKKIPSLVSQINLYVDKSGLIRVKGKFSKSNSMYKNFPILLSRNSDLTKLIIKDFHEKFRHSGIYYVTKEIRKLFWVPRIFSIVKKVIKDCIFCKRYKTSPIALNQSYYREQRVEPCKIPFSYIYIDHFGPYYVKFGNNKMKVWIFIITCMFTRAINLKVSLDMTVNEFLKAFQLHVFNFGRPQFIVSDLGTQVRYVPVRISSRVFSLMLIQINILVKIQFNQLSLIVISGDVVLLDLWWKFVYV